MVLLLLLLMMMVITNVYFLTITGYGLTEATAACTFNPTHSSLAKSGSVGLLLPNLEAMVCIGNHMVYVEISV